MPRRLPSSALDQQTQITASSTGAILAGNWYIGTGGAGSGGAVAGTLTGPLVGNADTATAWKNKVVVNGTDLIGNVTPITIGVNTTSNPAAGTYYPLFVPSSSAGNQQASTSAANGFKFDPSTNNLVVTGTLSGSNLSGTNTGDETTATIKTKLGITTLSGSNTGDQDLSGYAPLASPDFTGTVGTQNLTVKSQGNGVSYALSLANGTYRWDERLDTNNTLTWVPFNVGTAQGTKMALSTVGDLTIPGSYYGDGSHLTGITSFDGNYNSLTNKPSVNSLTQDTVMYGNNGVAYGLGAVPGYTYTFSNGGVDDYLYFLVPSDGNWSFTNINILFKGDRIGCTGMTSPSSYVIGSFEINATGVGWTTIATKWWQDPQINEVGADGAIRYVGVGGGYYSGSIGIGGGSGNIAQLSDQQFEKPYNIPAGANVRFRILWSVNIPTFVPPGGNGTTSATFAHGSITMPATQDLQWRAYPSPISYSGASWHMGAAVVFSAVRVG